MMDLAELKKRYSELEKKHRLPTFKDLNGNFEVDKIERDSDFLLRVIRKAMIEKVVNSLGFCEMLLNPVNAPRLYYSYIKSMGNDERKQVERMYSALAELSVNSLALEIDTNDKKEAELIIKANKVWESLKPDFRKVISAVQSPTNTDTKRDKSYFG